jgi:signal peptidase I
LFGVVPVFGAIVGGIWQIVVLVIAIVRVQRTSVLRAAIATVAGPLSLVLMALVLRSALLEAFKIPSGGMLPTLQINDHLFVEKLAYGARIPLTGQRIFPAAPAHGDIAVFEHPERPEEDYIKRVIALGGDEVLIENGHPIVNGWRVPSCRVGRYTYRETQAEEPKSGELEVEFHGKRSYLTLYEDARAEGQQGPYQVAPGEAFMMGDNRHSSADSRSWFGGRGGGVPYEAFKGRAWLVWMSFDKDGSVSADRFFLNLTGVPRLPTDASPELRAAFEQCLASRPPLAETSPPLR